MKVVEITSMHSKRNISVLNTFVFTDKDVLETRKRILRKDGFKYNRQERRYEKYLKGLKVTLTHSFDTSIQDSLEYEIIKNGYRYIDNEDGTFNVCYDHAQDSYFNEYSWHHVARVREDENTYYISCEGDSCEGEYYKNEWTFADALINQCGVF